MTRRVMDAAKQHDMQTASMDDETLLGTRFHTLTFGEAIAGDLLNDYPIVVIGVTESETRQLVEDRRPVEIEDTDLVDDAESLACMLALTKVIKQ